MSEDNDRDSSPNAIPESKKMPAIPTREVVVTHLDSPPPSGKESIHPRRPAPKIPERAERVADESNSDNDRSTD